MAAPAPAGASQSPPSESSRSRRSPAHGRMTRIRKACDMCRARKVKCDAAQPCRSCRDLGVECTFQYVSRRRGPTSKYVGMSTAPESGLVTAVSATTQDPQPPPLSSSSSQHLSVPSLPSPWPTDAIAPMPVLTLLLDDYFTYIHPLVPFPHEPTFRLRFANEAERRRPEFVALIASMVGSLAACFPRSSQGQPLPQADSGMTLKKRATLVVACCRDVALTARGTQLYSRRRLTSDDAATSYLLGLAAGYTLQWDICRRFMSETMAFVHELLGADLRVADNAIEDQMARRIFWIVFLAVRSILQEGTALGELPVPMLMHTMKQIRPPLPDEIDDTYLTPEGVVDPSGTATAMGAGSVSLITGFNRVVRVYMTMDRVLSAELLGAEKTTPEERASMLLEALQASKTLADELPDELYLPLPGSTRMMAPTAVGTPTATETADTTMEGGEPPVPGMVAAPSLYDNFYDDVPGYQYYPPGVEGGYVYRTPPGSSTDEPPDQNDDMRVLLDQEPRRRRQVQYDIQKTNIYASLLATRSYYIERYGQLVQAGSVGDEASRAVAVERDLIVRSLLLVLAIIPQCNMEPNGSALISKIRQVASTLLEAEGAVKTGASAQLGRFLEILVRLERLERASGDGGSSSGGNEGWRNEESRGSRHREAESTTGSTGTASVDMRPEDEAEELQGWASLREEQLRFVASEGFLSSQNGSAQWNWR